jgi:hypothetical protein
MLVWVFIVEEGYNIHRIVSLLVGDHRSRLDWEDIPPVVVVVQVVQVQHDFVWGPYSDDVHVVYPY